MPIANRNALECIEEASSSSSSDGPDLPDVLCKYDITELSTSTTECVNLQNSSINVDNSSDVVIGSVAHFHGPVSIYQSQSDAAAERLKGGGDEGKLVKSESVSSEKSCSGEDETNPKLRVLFVTMSFLIITALVSIVVYFTATASEPPFEETEPDKNLSDHRLIYREEWGGKPPLSKVPLIPPVEYVIISHTAGPFCSTTIECSSTVQTIQAQHVSVLQSPDIGYNFLIGGDANIYVGRDWGTRNFHMDGCIGISFIGNYVYDSLTDAMIEAGQMLLEAGLKKKVLSEEYKLIAHNQTYNTLSPGQNIYEVIKEWPHFYPGEVDY